MASTSEDSGSVDLSEDLSGDLSLSCSFSSFEEPAESTQGIEPYDFEPLASESSAASEPEDSPGDERLNNTTWYNTVHSIMD